MQNFLSCSATERLGDGDPVPKLSSPGANTPETVKSIQSPPGEYAQLPTKALTPPIKQRNNAIERRWGKTEDLSEAVQLSNCGRVPLHQRYGGLNDARETLQGDPVAKDQPSDTVIINVDEELYDILTAECPWFGA